MIHAYRSLHSLFCSFLILIGCAAQTAAEEATLLSANTIGIHGEITTATRESFHRLLDGRDIQTVELHSPGGSVASALSIANAIHEKGVNTWVKSGTDCFSACSLIFLSGKKRLVDGNLGVHQISADEDDNERTQLVVSYVFEALASFGTPDELITVMLRTPPDGMYVFTHEEIEKFGITRREGEIILPHLQVLSSDLYEDWLVGTFVNTHTNQVFYAMESRLFEPVLRIVYYPSREHMFGELIWQNKLFQPGKTDLEFVFERNANAHGPAATSNSWLRADVEETGYSWDFAGTEGSVQFMNLFIYGHQLRVLDFSAETLALYSLNGTLKATSAFIDLMGR